MMIRKRVIGNEVMMVSEFHEVVRRYAEYMKRKIE